MSEYDELYADEFFIIDSNKLNEVESEFYGYLIDEGNFYTRDNFNNTVNLSGLGAYINIDREYNEIIIKQDANGSFGLYAYKNEDVFCISNSFVKLLDYVKQRYAISFNEDAANTLLAYNYSSYIYKQTLVNEIEILPRNYMIKIEIDSKKISYDIIDYKEKTVDLDSQEAFDIIDNWFYRWTSLFRNLKKQTNNITADLTGGFDSRITFSLLLASNINLNEIHIRSIKDEVYTHKEDYQIASKIAKEFNFRLNDLSPFNLNRYYFEEKETSLKLSANIKLGIHHQLFYKYFKNVNPCYSITGYGGENIRDYSHVMPLHEYIELAESFSPELVESTKKIIDYNVNHIKNDFYGTYNDENVDYGISRETIHTYHFGRGTIEKYLTNEFSISPLSDPEINKIKRHDGIHIDKNLLIAIIYLRYCPKLLDFDFNGTSEIKKETIEYAKKFNEKYPFTFNGYELASSELKNTTRDRSHSPISVREIDENLKEIFFSKAFRKQFEIYYSPELYNKFATRIKTMKYVPLQFACPAFIIMKVLNDIEISKFNADEDWYDWLNHFIETGNDYGQIDNEIIEKLLIYNTARIDIINKGANNDIEFISCSDTNSIHKKPAWIKPEVGGGLVVESKNNSMDLKFRCVKDGKLDISLKGKDVRDKNRNRFPVYIDYSEFTVNGAKILKENILTWHDKPYVYSKNVKNGEEITIHVAWKPFDHQSTFK